MKTAFCGTPVTESEYNEHVVSCSTCRANYVNNVQLNTYCRNCGKERDVDVNSICTTCRQLKDYDEL